MGIPRIKELKKQFGEMFAESYRLTQIGSALVGKF